MYEIPHSTPFIKDALGPRWLSQIWKIWYVSICLSMESDLSPLWAQWLSPKHPQRLCKVCWSIVLLFKDFIIAVSRHEHSSGKTMFSMASCFFYKRASILHHANGLGFCLPHGRPRSTSFSSSGDFLLFGVIFSSTIHQFYFW